MADALARGGDPDAWSQEAATIIREVAADLKPERAAAYLAAPEVVDVLDKAR